MKKQLKTILTKEYGYVLVSDDEIKEGDWIYYSVTDKILQWNEKTPSRPEDKKLIATSTQHKIEGVLQYVIVDDEEIDEIEFNAIFSRLPEGMQSEGNPRDTIDKRTLRKKAFKYYCIGFKATKQLNLSETIEVEYEELHLMDEAGRHILKLKLNSNGKLEIKI